MLQKALRRGEVVDAAWACNEMLPRYAQYVWRRLFTVSAEDCAGMVTGEIVAIYDAWSVLQRHNPNHPRAHRVFFAKAIVLLAKCKHSRDSDELGLLISDRVTDEHLEKAFAEAKAHIVDDPPPPLNEDATIPDYVYDVHTRRGRRAGRTVEAFLKEEHEALTDRSSMWRNWRDLSQSPVYVEPEVDFDA
jgi:hypothetical protein